MKYCRQVLRHVYLLLHPLLPTDTSLATRTITLLKKPYIFWMPLTGATALALTTAAPPYPGIEINDKILHIVTFLYLTLAWFWISKPHQSPYRIASILFLYGLLIEGIQSFLPLRTCSLTDAAANGLGILLGLGLAKSFQYIQRQQESIPSSPLHQKQSKNLSSKSQTATT